MVPTALIAIALLAWEDYRGATDVLWALRGAAVLLALGAAYTFDDAAASTTAAVPTPIAVRRGARLVVVCTAVAVAWAGLLSYGALVASEPVPAAALTLELAAVLAVVLAVGAAVSGTAAAPAVVALLLLAMRLPARWSLLADAPGTVEWRAAHQRWAAVLLIAVVGLVVASRDPAARPLLRRT